MSTSPSDPHPMDAAMQELDALIPENEHVALTREQYEEQTAIQAHRDLLRASVIDG